MAVIDLLNTIFTDLDQAGQSSLQSMYTSISTAISPVFKVGLTIYIGYYGYEIIFGRAKIAATEFFWRVVRISIIWALIFNWGDFQSAVANVLLQTGDSLGATICGSMAQISGSSGSSVSCPSPSATSGGYSAIATGLSNVWLSASGAAKTMVGTLSPVQAILAILVDLITILVIVETVFVLIMGKMGLYVLLGLAPIFISMALFNFSSSLFTGWMRTCVGFALIPVLTYGFLGFFLGLISGQAAAFASVPGNTWFGVVNGQNAENQAMSMALMAPYFVMCFVACLMLMQIPGLASGIAGGAGLRHSSTMAVAQGFAMGLLANLFKGDDEKPRPPNPGPPKPNAPESGNGMSAGSNNMSAGVAQVEAGLKANRS